MEHNASLLDIEYFLERYAKNKKVRLLDVGCVDGKKVLGILDRGGFDDVMYVGLDSVYWDAENSRPSSANGRTFVYGDACNLPFEDSDFDLVIMSHVFEHIEDSERLCSEIKRVTKKNGHVLVIVPLEKGGMVGFINRNRNLWKHLRYLLSWLRILPYNPVSPHVHFKSYKEYSDYFKKKFEVVESYTRGSFGMLALSFFHETLMGFARQKINVMEIVERNFPRFFQNTYRKNTWFKMDATFILKPKD